MMNELNEYLDRNVKFYTLTTKDITVSAAPLFVDEESVPEENKFFWAYYIRVENNSDKNVQLLNKSLMVADSFGNTRVARDLDQREQQPVIIAGEAYEYTGLTPLDSPSGIIAGKIGVISESGEIFEIAIPAFSLDSPYEKRVLN